VYLNSPRAEVIVQLGEIDIIQELVAHSLRSVVIGRAFGFGEESVCSRLGPEVKTRTLLLGIASSRNHAALAPVGKGHGIQKGYIGSHAHVYLCRHTTRRYLTLLGRCNIFLH
jgi:hypothetical protein